MSARSRWAPGRRAAGPRRRLRTPERRARPASRFEYSWMSPPWVVTRWLDSSRSVVARLVADEPARAQLFQRLLDLRPRVHHEGPAAGDRLTKLASRGAEDAPSSRARPGRHDVAVPAHHVAWRVDGRLLRPDPRVA